MQASIGAVLFTAAPMSALGAVLKSQTKAKGFFGDLAKGVVGIGAQALMGQQQGQMNPQAMQAQQDAANVTQQQRILEKKLQKELENLQKVKSEVDFMKDQGLLEKAGGAQKLQAKATSSEAIQALQQGKSLPMGGALTDFEAPIIFLEPPPVSPSQLIEAAELSKATLERIGEDTSPVMKAIKEFEEKKLGRVGANNLGETKEEIRETQAMIKKRQTEREALLSKLKEKGRELAKTGSKRTEKEANYVKNDLREKDKELDILANKMLILKRKEANLISMMGGKASKEEPEEEAKGKEDKEEEDEEEEEL